MKLTINKPQNGYQGWSGFLTDAAGKRHVVGADMQCNFETRAALIKRARYDMTVIEAGAKKLAAAIDLMRAQGAHR